VWVEREGRRGGGAAAAVRPSPSLEQHLSLRRWRAAHLPHDDVTRDVKHDDVTHDAVTQMTTAEHNEARRFITLVDELYEHKVHGTRVVRACLR
jgi:predicted ATPase